MLNLPFDDTFSAEQRGCVCVSWRGVPAGGERGGSATGAVRSGPSPCRSDTVLSTAAGFFYHWKDIERTKYTASQRNFGSVLITFPVAESLGKTLLSFLLT